MSRNHTHVRLAYAFRAYGKFFLIFVSGYSRFRFVTLASFATFANVKEKNIKNSTIQTKSKRRKAPPIVYAMGVFFYIWILRFEVVGDAYIRQV